MSKKYGRIILNYYYFIAKVPNFKVDNGKRLYEEGLERLKMKKEKMAEATIGISENEKKELVFQPKVEKKYV